MKMLKNNWWLKLTALAFAILLWAAITGTTDPERTYQITDIPIQYINEDSIYDAGMTYYTDGTEYASVEVRVRQSQFKNISASDFKATVDLSKRYSETGRVELKLEVVGNKKLLEGNYKQLQYSVHIRTEKISTEEFIIEPIVKGTLAYGYSYNVIKVEPKRVNVTAPESVLETISRAVVTVSLSDNTDDVSLDGDIVLFDNSDREINLKNHPEIELDTLQARVYIPVLKVNAIPVIVQVSGENAVSEGYRYTDYECDITSVEIEGERAEVDNIQQIVISGGEVDITDAAGDVSVVVNINDYLPDGVHVAGERNLANIVFKVEKLQEKDISISYKDIQMNGQRTGYEYEIVGTGEVNVSVIGLEEDLDRVKASNISLSINVVEFGEGEYLAVLSAKPIEGFEIVTPSTVTVKVTAVNSIVSTESPSIQEPESSRPQETTAPTQESSEESTVTQESEGEA